MSPITSEAPEQLARSRFADRLRASGWRVKDVPGQTPDEVSFALLASRPANQEERTETLLIYAFVDATEVRVGDLWRLLCDGQRVRADAAVLCLGETTRLSRQAVAAAERLQVQVLRLVA